MKKQKIELEKDDLCLVIRKNGLEIYLPKFEDDELVSDDILFLSGIGVLYKDESFRQYVIEKVLEQEGKNNESI